MMVKEPSETEKEEQRKVQRLLGRGILRLQLYERLLKALLADCTFSGEVRDLEANRAKRESRVARNTLGTLVGEFVGSFLVTATAQESSDPAEDAADGPDTVSFRMTRDVAPDDHAQTALGLKELVDLRNMLVHHFVDQHDLWSVEGCQRAQEALVGAYDRIDAHCLRLESIAKSTVAARQYVAEAMQTEAFREKLTQAIGVPGSASD